MSFCRGVQCIIFATFLALIYISMQMQIVSLAYEGKAQEQEMSQLIEDKNNITYDILVMKSANHIGSQLLAADPSLNFASETAVIEIAAPVVEEPVLAQTNTPRQATLFSQLLSFVSSDAQARVLNR